MATAERKISVTGAAQPDVVVRVRGSVVPVRASRTAERPVVPVAAQEHRIFTQPAPCFACPLSKLQPSFPPLTTEPVLFGVGEWSLL